MEVYLHIVASRCFFKWKLLSIKNVRMTRQTHPVNAPDDLAGDVDILTLIHITPLGLRICYDESNKLNEENAIAHDGHLTPSERRLTMKIRNRFEGENIVVCTLQVVEGMMMSTKAIVLTPPVALESSASDQAEYKAPNIIQCIFSLFKNIRPGTDLTHFELPPLFNLPKSQLQCYGESVYCTSVGEDLLSKCNKGGLKLRGASIEAIVNGKRRLKLLSHGETYVMNSPKLWIRVFPVPSTGWGGNVRIDCKESGLEAQLCYKGTSFLGIGGNPRSLKGKILESSTLMPLYEIDGCWDSTVVAKEVKTGKTIVIYDAKEALSRLETPQVKDPYGLSASESAVVWGEVSQSILKKEWEKASKAKKAIEEKQRKDGRERKSRGETWVPKHFNLTHTKEEGWDCTPKAKCVPPAPIVASL
ncbi:hypothetical protein Syun_024782 [Stephania yunnanensis]|uniref:Oxysterol-binding protein n=1 Tax=Stephania yunnanensis TaxID=152371 RepID=A0AAP0HUB4_9MAGN